MSSNLGNLWHFSPKALLPLSWSLSCFCVSPLGTSWVLHLVRCGGGVRLLSSKLAHREIEEAHCTVRSANGRSQALPRGLRGDTGWLTHSWVYTSYSIPRLSLCPSWVRSQDQAMPQSWWLFFLAWEAGRRGLTQMSSFPRFVTLNCPHSRVIPVSSPLSGQWEGPSRCLQGAGAQ